MFLSTLRKLRRVGINESVKREPKDSVHEEGVSE
jgi:hypothetical protein